MTYAEIIKDGKVIRFQDGQRIEAGVRYCDGHGRNLPDINGRVVKVDEVILWLCEECANPSDSCEGLI